MNEEKSSLDEKYVSHFKNVSLSVIPFQKKSCRSFSTASIHISIFLATAIIISTKTNLL